MSGLQMREQSTPEWKGAMSNLLQGVPWQVNGHLTFPFPVSEGAALKRFSEFHNRAERDFQTHIAYVFGKECDSKKGGNVGWHFHFLAAALKPLEATRLISLWGETLNLGFLGDSAVVKPYDRQKGAAAYLLKLAGKGANDWDLNWKVRMFLPQPARENTHRANRYEKRHSRSHLAPNGENPLHQLHAG